MNLFRAPVAQLDRAFASGAKGRPFESARAYQSKALNMRLIRLTIRLARQILAECGNFEGKHLSF
jgi:hypothetical protein